MELFKPWMINKKINYKNSSNCRDRSCNSNSRNSFKSGINYCNSSCNNKTKQTKKISFKRRVRTSFNMKQLSLPQWGPVFL